MKLPFRSSRPDDDLDHGDDDLDVYGDEDLDVYGGEERAPVSPPTSPSATDGPPPPPSHRALTSDLRPRFVLEPTGEHRAVEVDADRVVDLDRAHGDDRDHERDRDDDRDRRAVPPPVARRGRADQDGPSGGGDGGGAGGNGRRAWSTTTAELARRTERLRADGGLEQRSAWSYLGVLGVLFVLIVGFGYGCSDVRGNDIATSDPAQVMAGGEPNRLVFRVDGDVIVLQGSVPDQAAHDQIVAAAGALYQAENVVNELVVDEDTTLEEGTIRVVGSALSGDERAGQLQDRIAADFGLANRGFEVGFSDTAIAPVDAIVSVGDGSVTLSGILPDEQSVADLVALVGDIWGAERVDGSSLSVGDTTWTDGRIRVVGTTATSDQRIGELVAQAPERIATLVTVDTSGLTLADDSSLRAEIQSSIADIVTADPIRFAPNSAGIDPASDAVLVQVGELLAQLPDIPFEVVGHTDDAGEEETNLVLSQDRAAAVVTRLAELGIDPGRMSSRGEGESNPIADNATADGKAANRRIEFVLVGTSTADPSDTNASG
ncbi:MAG: OmpA family protein [Acidimicrobiales bacterium]